MGGALVLLAAWLAEAFCRKHDALNDGQHAKRGKNDRECREIERKKAEKQEKGYCLRALHQSR